MQFVWESYTTTVISLLPPICVVGSVAWCAVVPLICFQVIEWHQPYKVLRQFGMQQPISESHSQPLNIRGITLKGKHDENWGQLFAPMIDQWNNRHAFRVDAYPLQEGLLSFNSDYMVWYIERQRCLLTHKMQTRLHWYFFNLFEYLTMNIFLMMAINFLTLIIAG